jgi:hypothetical protein
MVQKKFVNHPLAVSAIDAANVRAVEPDGSVLQELRFVGKTLVQTDMGWEWQVVPGGVIVPYSAHIINELKHGALLPANNQTAVAAGVKFVG